jgi:hypothetical protein
MGQKHKIAVNWQLVTAKSVGKPYVLGHCADATCKLLIINDL